MKLTNLQKNNKINAEQIWASTNNWAAVLNCALLVVAAGLVLYYVFLANRLVTIAYQEKQMNNQLADLTVRHGDLAAQQANTSTLSNLSAFAQNAGLVEQAVPDSIFSDTSLAQN